MVSTVYTVKVWDYFIIALATELIFVALSIHLARNGGNLWIMTNCALIILSSLGLAAVAYAYF
jgi:hypothetical protein